MVWELLAWKRMISITDKANENDRAATGMAEAPANVSEPRRAGTWGLVIASGLLLLAATLICLMLFAA
jgi:hypothetical protein